MSTYINPLTVFVAMILLAAILVAILKPKHSDPDWRGRLHKRFRWSRMRMEYGRLCYKTNWMGQTLACWWEWERK